MPTDANGNYSLPPGYQAVTGQTIQPSQHNPPLEDIAEALTGRMARNGSTVMTGPLQMGANRITGLSPGVNPTDAATVSQLPAPLVSVDNQIARFNGIVGNIQGSDAVIDDQGQMGLGTALPTAKLHVVGTARITGAATFDAAVNVPNGAFGVSKIAASGTPSSATFLRGDGTWSAATGTGGGTVTSVSGTGGLTGTVTASGSISIDTNNAGGIGSYVMAYPTMIVANGGTISGVNLSPVTFNINTSAAVYGTTLPGTWRNVSGVMISNEAGLFIRIA